MKTFSIPPSPNDIFPHVFAQQESEPIKSNPRSEMAALASQIDGEQKRLKDAGLPVPPTTIPSVGSYQAMIRVAVPYLEKLKSIIVPPKSAAQRLADSRAEVAALASANAKSLANIARARGAAAGSKPVATAAPTATELWKIYATLPISEKRAWYLKHEKLLS